MPDRVGIDVGGSFIKAGLVGPDGAVTHRSSVATDVAAGARVIEERIAEAVRRLPVPPDSGPIGLGLPGVVDIDAGVVRQSPNIPCWRDYPAARRLAEVLGAEVRIENDANCAALGEALAGAGRGVRSFLLVTLGTGVGGGAILDGRLWRGESGRAGEIGHVVVDPEGEACGCGSRGCLETVASSRGILRAASSLGLGGPVEDLARRARDGSPREAGLFESAGRALGIAVAGWLNILDVHTIVVGGGMLPALDLMRPCLLEEVSVRAYSLQPQAVRILPALLGEDAGIVGAARLASAGQVRDIVGNN